jgi:hypothetical protein
MKIKVIRVETFNTKNGTGTAIFDAKNTRFSGFHATLHDIQPGDTIDADIEIDGKYNNIVAVKEIIKGTPESQAEAAAVNATNATVERASIEAQVAAKIGADLLVAKVINLNHDLAQATIHWTLQKLGKYCSKEKPLEVVPKPIEDDRLPADIKNAGNLLSALRNLIPAVTRTELYTALRLDESALISDLEGAWKAARRISRDKANKK